MATHWRAPEELLVSVTALMTIVRTLASAESQLTNLEELHTDHGGFRQTFKLCWSISGKFRSKIGPELVLKCYLRAWHHFPKV